jgi:hypothetical protein
MAVRTVGRTSLPRAGAATVQAMQDAGPTRVPVAAVANLSLAGAALVHAARQIAEHAHAGRLDKAGRPYIGHPARVAALMPSAGLQATAWLHDVLEDTADHPVPITPGDLERAGIPGDVVRAVVALTKREQEPYGDAIARAATDPLGLAVKAGDITDNSDPGRLALIEPDVADALRAKYADGWRALRAAGAARYGQGSRVLVIDDVRVFDDLPDAAYARSSETGLAALVWHQLTDVPLDELWLDHHLGPGDSIRPVVAWLAEAYRAGRAPQIGRAVVHTSDPAGAREVMRLLDGWTELRRVDPRDVPVSMGS